MPLKKSQKSLKKWTKEEWGTKSGKPSTQGKKATGERYLPKKARQALTKKEYAATSRKKRADTKAGFLRDVAAYSFLVKDSLAFLGK